MFSCFFDAPQFSSGIMQFATFDFTSLETPRSLAQLNDSTFSSISNIYCKALLPPPNQVRFYSEQGFFSISDPDTNAKRNTGELIAQRYVAVFHLN